MVACAGVGAGVVVGAGVGARVVVGAGVVAGARVVVGGGVGAEVLVKVTAVVITRNNLIDFALPTHLVFAHDVLKKLHHPLLKYEILWHCGVPSHLY